MGRTAVGTRRSASHLRQTLLGENGCEMAVQSGQDSPYAISRSSVFADAGEVSCDDDEAAEALLNLQQQARPSPALMQERLSQDTENSLERQGRPHDRSYKRNLRTGREERNVKPKRAAGKTVKSASELPKRCSCGKHISKDHPLCKSNVKELLERFLDKYCRGAQKGSVVDLQQAEVEFDVALRRLYDILVVLEAAQVLLRVSSKKYEVLGMGDTKGLMIWLDKYQEQREHIIKNGVKDEKIGGREQGGSYDLSCMLMIHLKNQQEPVLLSNVAEVLKGRSPRAKACKKTIERRIYDISSVLETLNLIKRSYQPPNKQPSFEWNRDLGQTSERPCFLETVSDSLGQSERQSVPILAPLGGPLDFISRASISSAFSNWSPAVQSDATERSEDLNRRYSSDQLSERSNQTAFRRPSPPRAWPAAGMSSFAPDIQSRPRSPLSSPGNVLSLAPTSSALGRTAGILWTAGCTGLVLGLSPMPDSSSSFSIPPLDLLPPPPKHIFPADVMDTGYLGGTICKPQAIRAQGQAEMHFLRD